MLFPVEVSQPPNYAIYLNCGIRYTGITTIPAGYAEAIAPLGSMQRLGTSVWANISNTSTCFGDNANLTTIEDFWGSNGQVQAKSSYRVFQGIFSNNPLLSDLGQTKLPRLYKADGTLLANITFISCFENCPSLRSVQHLFDNWQANGYTITAAMTKMFALSEPPGANEGLTPDNRDVIKTSLLAYNTDAKILSSVDGSDTVNTAFLNQTNLISDL